MALKTVFHDIAEVPEKFRELYSETSPGVWTLTGIEGVKTAQDFLQLRSSMEQRLAEAEHLRALCEKNGIQPDRVDSLFDEFADLKAKLATRDSAIQAERIKNALRETALKMGVRAEALPDVLARASIFETGEDGTVRGKPENGGVGVAEWLEKQLRESPHWLAPSRSAGVRQNIFPYAAHAEPRNSMAELIAESWNNHR